MNADTNNSSLKSRVMRAGAWVMGGHVLGQLLRLISNLIMTRLLVPEMFGIMAVANILIVGLILLSDLGLQQNVIQSKRGNDPVFLNTVWTVQILRGALITIFALAAAFVIHLVNAFGGWPTGSVYAEPILPYVLGVLAINGLINGLESTKLATANRELSMGMVTRIEVISQAAGMLFMIAWAMFDRSIWALVVGTLFGSVLKSWMSHALLPGVSNRLHWNWEAFWEIFHFGKWIFLTSILGFNVNNGDRLVLGLLISAATLGLYVIAFFMMNALQMVIMTVASSVVFPALSEVVRDRPGELRQTYYRFRKPVDIGILFIAGFLFACGHWVIDILYDDRYQAAGPMFEILAITLILERYVISEQCFIALGKPKLLAPLIGLRIFAIYGLMPLMFYWYGLEAALWVIAGGRLIMMPLLFHYKKRYDLISWSDELRYLPLFFVGLLVGWLFDTMMVGILD